MNDRQRRIFTLAAMGYTNAQISARLRLSQNWVEFNISKLSKELGVQKGTNLRHAILAMQYEEIATLRRAQAHTTAEAPR